MSLNDRGVKRLMEMPETPLHNGPPRDPYNAAYFIFVLLGVGVMFPWNAFLTAFDYFSNMFCDFPFEFIMSIVFNVSNITFQFVFVGLGERMSLTSRVLLTFAPFVVVMAIIPFTAAFFEATNARLGFTLGLVAIAGFSTSLGFNCVVGLASQYPPEYVGAFMTGNGVAGVVVGLMAIITKVAYPLGKNLNTNSSNIIDATIIYFVCAAVIEFTCIIAYFVLLRMAFSRYYMSQRQVDKAAQSEDETAKLLASPPGGEAPVSLLSVLRKIGLMSFTVWSVFFLTLSLFPGMTSIIPDYGSTWNPVILIFLFQVFDFVGRMLPRWLRIIPRRVLWIASLLRLTFGGLFLLCILPLGNTPIFASPWAGFVIMSLFALTNGYFGTLAMMYAPDEVSDHEKATAGRIMSMSLQMGIFSAVFFALLILYLVDKCRLPLFLLAGADHTYCSAHATNSTIMEDAARVCYSHLSVRYQGGVRQQSWFVTTAWLADSFTVEMTDGKTVYQGRATAADVLRCVNNDADSVPGMMALCRECLVTAAADATRFTHDLELLKAGSTDLRFTFTMREVVDAEPTSIATVMALVLAPVADEKQRRVRIQALLLALLERETHNAARIAELEAHNAQLTEQLTAATELMDTMTQDKAAMETALYRKFATLLNTKKDEIERLRSGGAHVQMPKKERRLKSAGDAVAVKQERVRGSDGEAEVADPPDGDDDGEGSLQPVLASLSQILDKPMAASVVTSPQSQPQRKRLRQVAGQAAAAAAPSSSPPRPPRADAARLKRSRTTARSQAAPPAASAAAAAITVAPSPRKSAAGASSKDDLMDLLQ